MKQEKGNQETICVKRNIYDKYGGVYIAKGTQLVIDEERRSVFQKIGIWDQIEANRELSPKEEAPQKPHPANGTESAASVSMKQEQDKAVVEIPQDCEALLTEIQKWKERFRGVEPQEFDRAARFVSELVFEEKIFQQYPYLNTLAAHADWYYAHSINVAVTSVLLARKIGFTEDVIKEIALGAILHDVGVIFVDNGIVNRTDSELSDQEIELKKKHCDLGVMTVKSSGAPYRSQMIIEQHHERLDGSGYPYGLKQGEIFEEAHIVALADVLDTETTHTASGSMREIDAVLDEMYQTPEKYNQRYVNVLTGCFRS